MAVAIAAPVIAIAGTAVAGVGTISVLSKNDKKQIRRIAGKVAEQQVRALASGLAVASAANAGSPGTADRAKSADFATKAGNAPEQLWAVVNADGTLSRGSPGVSSSMEEVGKYLVLTDRDISDCFLAATIGGNEPGMGLVGSVSVNKVSGDPKGVYIFTSSGHPFTLLISC